MSSLITPRVIDASSTAGAAAAVDAGGEVAIAPSNLQGQAHMSMQRYWNDVQLCAS